jgi:TonB family protein
MVHSQDGSCCEQISSSPIRNAFRQTSGGEMLKLYGFTMVLLASFPFQIQNRTCDHAAPPAGMHYVCEPKNTCNCHLEKNPGENEEPSTDADAVPATEPCADADLKFFVAPAYPPAARHARKQGTVTAKLLVEGSGGAQVTIESGDPVFAEAITGALKKWRFASRAQSKTLNATFTFALAGDPSEPMNTTISGSSPLNLVIAATPPH